MQSLSTGKFVETIGWKKMSQQLCKASVDTITGKKLSLLSCTQYNSQLLPYSSYMYAHMLRLVPLFWGLWWTGRQWWHGAGSAGRVDQSEARELPPAAHHFWQQNHPTVEEGIVALSYSCSNTLDYEHKGSFTYMEFGPAHLFSLQSDTAGRRFSNFSTNTQSNRTLTKSTVNLKNLFAYPRARR